MSQASGLPGGRPATATAQPPLRRVVVAVAALYAIVVGFIVARVLTDWPHIMAGTVPDQAFAQRYVRSPYVPYAHIALGVVYLAGAPFQLSRRFRSANYRRHRLLGRALAAAALASGLLALLFGLVAPWGGVWEASATLVFGSWFVWCLARGVHAIRSGDVATHRRWMIRAFTVSVGIGTIRIWIGIFTAALTLTSSGGELPDLPRPLAFGISFWLAFALHVVGGEWWLRRTRARGSSGLFNSPN